MNNTGTSSNKQESSRQVVFDSSLLLSCWITKNTLLEEEKSMDRECSPLLSTLQTSYQGLPNNIPPILLPSRWHDQSLAALRHSSFHPPAPSPRADFSSLTEYVQQIIMIDEGESVKDLICPLTTLDKKEPETNGVDELVARLPSLSSSSSDIMANQQEPLLFPRRDLIMALEPTPIGPGVNAVFPSNMLQCSSCKESLSGDGPISTRKTSSFIIPVGGGGGDEDQENRSLCNDNSVCRHPLLHKGSTFINLCEDKVTSRASNLSSFQQNGHSNKQETEEGRQRRRFRAYEEDLWTERFNELLQFKDAQGHCLVPHTYPDNLLLSQWVKRQRYQFKLKAQGRHSTLTDDRQQMLEAAGFVWHCHHASWYEKLEALKKYQAGHGDCRVPPNYHDRSLAVWVKRQRRQWKLLRKGRTQVCAISKHRIALLEKMGFEWNPRGL